MPQAVYSTHAYSGQVPESDRLTARGTAEEGAEVTAADGAIIVAAVGVLGTLLSPLISSWVSIRGKQQEFEFSLRDKNDKRLRNEAREAFAERRNCYISLNAAVRDYHASLRASSHSVEAGRPREGYDELLIKVRGEYRFRYAEAQMIVPDRILEIARQIHAILADAYGMLRRLEEGLASEGETPQAVRSLLDTAWEPLRNLRSEMRSDLGVGGSSDADSES